MSSLNYTTYVSQTANLMAAVSSDPNFVTMLPGAIDYAEQRIYRDIPFLATVTTLSSFTTTASVRTLQFNTSTLGSFTPGDFITVSQVNVVSSAGTSLTTGTRVQLIPTSREFIDAAFPATVSSQCGTPEYYAIRDNVNIVFGPCPDGAYTTEVIGMQRPTVLSSANSSTILTQYVPDLFMAATMVFVSGYMRDFGQQADNPQMGTAWEQQYQMLMKTGQVEQLRANFRGDAWTSEFPSPVAQPTRR